MNNAGSGGNISNAQQQINDNESNISTNTSDIATNTADIATNAADIVSLDARVTALEGATTMNLKVERSLNTVVDFSSTNVGDGAWVEIVADTGSDVVRKVQAFYPDGDILRVALGAAASEVEEFLIYPGGPDQSGIEVEIPANSRVSIRLISGGTTNTSGVAGFQFLVEA